MGLLILNALKGLKKKKVQMIGIIFCIMLSAGIYTAMSVSLDRLENKYHSYLKEQNVEDFAFVPNIDYENDYTAEEVQGFLQNELKDIPDAQKQLVTAYYYSLAGIYKPNNMDQIYAMLDFIFNDYGINDKKVYEKIGPLKEKYGFDYGRAKEKVLSEDNYLFKFIPYIGSQKINIPYLVEGKMPEAKNEITLLPKFAKNNNISVGDTYKIGEVEYKVVGLANSPEHILPLISINKPIYEEAKDSIIYMTSETFDEAKGVFSSSYVAAFKDRESTFEIEKLQDIFKDDENIKLSYTVALRLMRTLSLEAEISTDRLFAKYMLYLLLAISVVIILVVMKKRIEDERLQIGILKSLGYKSYKIAFSYLVYPVIGSIIGGLIGYLIGISLNEPITSLFASYFNLPLTGFEFDYHYLLDTTIIPMIVLSVLSYVIALIMLRKKPLKLLKEGTNLKVNLFSRFIAKVTKKLGFNTRFKLSLASRSLGKLIIVIVTSFCTGMLIVLTLIGMNIFTSMLDNSFEGLKFNSMVSYESIIKTDKASEDEDLIYSTTLNILKVEESDGSITEVKDKDDEYYTMSMYGIDKNVHFIDLLDENKETLNQKLVEDTDMIISSKIADLIKVKVGDLLYLGDSNSNEYQYKIVGINNSYFGDTGYVDRKYLSEKITGDYSYNVKYTCDEKYLKMSDIEDSEREQISNIFNISTLKDNMAVQMSAYNGSIYIVISFAAVLAFIILLVIANVIVEENKKTISLMKVLGYENKNISKIVLNIYTPFVIIAYLISIPAMENLLKYIMNQIASDIEMNIPVSLSLVKALIGLVGLLIGYYGAIFVSRKSLNKVPLSVALKRE